MRQYVFVEKKTEYAFAARRLHRHLTESLEMNHITDVRILRCMMIDTPSVETELPLPLLYDALTDDIVREEDIRRSADDADTACICVIPLFRRPAEQMIERALRMTPGGGMTVAEDAEDEDDALAEERLYFRQADLFLIGGVTEEAQRERLRALLINPASSAELPLFTTGTLPPLSRHNEEDYMSIRGFRSMDDEALTMLAVHENFRMSGDDLRFIQSYFRVEEKRDPGRFELRMMDTYWSDHCRHITFLTALQDLTIEDREIADTFEMYLETREALYGARPKNITLMDIATVAEKHLIREGKTPRIVETGERNAFTVRAAVYPYTGQNDAAARQPVSWLLHFKNETHNHSTERDPFFGAQSSFGATIADPLSARAEVFAAMRLSGVPNPLVSWGKTSREEKDRYASYLRLARESADGFSSFGVQSGIPTGWAAEYLHPGFAAKHMEVCFTAAAAPEEGYLSAVPIPGDIILLIGAKTGRDGLGGGLSASAGRASFPAQEAADRHTYTSQIGDPLAARALVRLMRRRDLMRYVKRAEDVSSGGIAIAAAEIAAGVRIDLDRVPTSVSDRLSFGGVMDPYEIAFSETQARMLLVVPSIHQGIVSEIAAQENLEAVVIGTVTAERRFRMHWWDRCILSLSRDFLDATGAERRVSAHIPAADTENLFRGIADRLSGEDITERYLRLMMHPEVASQKALCERFDNTAGGRAVVAPFGGKRMLTPTGYMAYRFPTEIMDMGATHTCAVFSCGYLPRYAAQSAYHGAYLSVLEAICRLAAAGIPLHEMTLSLQEYFPTVGEDPDRMGVPVAAMLGAFRAQMDYEVAAVGGKDSMNGTGARGDVPPTVIAFGAAAAEQESLLTPEFKKAGSRVYLLTPTYSENHLPVAEDVRGLLQYLQRLHHDGALLSCRAVGSGGIAAAIAQMCFGNGIGFNYEGKFPARVLFEDKPGAFLVETDLQLRGDLIGYTKDTANIYISGASLPLPVMAELWQKPEEKLYSSGMQLREEGIVPAFPVTPHPVGMPCAAVPKPRVLLPVLPYLTGEDVLAARFAKAGFEPIRMLFSADTQRACIRSAKQLAAMLEEVQVLAFPGGSYPGYGSIPAAVTDPAARFAQAVFSYPPLAEALQRFRQRSDTLVLGLGEGFRMLLASGLLEDDGGYAPSERIVLTENPCGHLVSRFVRVRVMSAASPWMHFCESGDVYTLPVASKAGRCLISDDRILELGAHGQIAGQYVDADNNPTLDGLWNPFGSDYAVESLFSADGRVMGRMTHCDRVDNTLCINIGGNREMRIFDAAMEYYKVK